MSQEDICPECGEKLPDHRHCDTVSFVYPNGFEVAIDFNKNNVWVKESKDMEAEIVTGGIRKVVIDNHPSVIEEFRKRGVKPY